MFSGKRASGVAIVCTVAFVIAAPASASVVSTTVGPLQLDAGPLEANEITVTQTGADSWSITDTAGLTETSPYCSPVSGTEIGCAGVSTFAAVRAGDLADRVTLNLTSAEGGADGGPGDDVIDASGTTSAVEGDKLWLSGGEGDDRVIGSARWDDIDTDRLGANLPIEGDAGDDDLSGGAGLDFIVAGTGADKVSGGEGQDTVYGILPPPFGLEHTTQADMQEDGAIDTIECGSSENVDRPDMVYLGQGDQVALDCELLGQFVSCPEGSACVAQPQVTVPAAGPQAAAAAAKKGKKGKKGRQVVLGRQPKQLKIPAGSRALVGAVINPSRARKVFGKRTQVPTTYDLGVSVIRHGRKVPRTKRKVRFKLKKG